MDQNFCILTMSDEESLRLLLADDRFDSKDWRASNLVDRVYWLILMYENTKADVSRLEKLNLNNS
jgi:hypothetical protein